MNGKILYYNHRQTPLALSNMLIKQSATVEDITDVIEDAKTTHDLIFGLHILYTKEMIYEWFDLDRETDSYVRLISKDKLGNRHYLKVFK